MDSTRKPHTVDLDLFVEGMGRLGFAPSQVQIDQIDAFLQELSLWSRSTNLVHAQGDEIVTRHLLDSLAALPVIAALPHASLLDVGSGGGFPGLPLAVMLPEARVTLLERSARKAAFLRNVVAIAGLQNASVLESPIERHHGVHDMVCCRAFAQVEETLRKLIKNLAPGGRLVLYKGRRDTVQSELDESETSRLCEATLQRIEVPFLNEERHLLIFRPRK